MTVPLPKLQNEFQLKITKRKIKELRELSAFLQKEHPEEFDSYGVLADDFQKNVDEYKNLSGFRKWLRRTIGKTIFGSRLPKSEYEPVVGDRVEHSTSGRVGTVLAMKTKSDEKKVYVKLEGQRARWIPAGVLFRVDV